MISVKPASKERSASGLEIFLAGKGAPKRLGIMTGFELTLLSLKSSHKTEVVEVLMRGE